MKAPEQNELLNDVLGGDELSASRDATLAAGLDALRRCTRRRRQFHAAAILALLLVLVLRGHFRPAIPVGTKFAAAPAPAKESSKVTYINQKELFALFPNRPIALIGEPGHQQFLLLDELKSTQEQ